MTIPPPGIDHNLGGRQYLNPYPHMTENKSEARDSSHSIS